MSNARPFEISGLNQTAAYNDWDGTLDEIAVYDRVLSLVEVGYLYNTNLGQTMDYNLPAPVSDNPDSQVSIATLSNISVRNSESELCVLVQAPIAIGTTVPDTYRHSMVYAYWQDSDNWLRWRIYAKNGDYVNTYGTIELDVGGTITKLEPDVILTTAKQGQYLGVVIQQFAFTKYRFVFNETGYYYQDGEAYTNQPVYDVDVSYITNLINPEAKVVTLGGAGHDPIFRRIEYSQYAASLDIEELATSIATKASIFDYKFDRLVEEKFYDSSLWTTISFPNIIMSQRRLILTNTNYHTLPRDKDRIEVSSFYNPIQITDGDLEFEAKVIRLDNVDTTKSYGLDILFRVSGLSGTSPGYGIPPPNSLSYAARIQNRQSNTGSRVITAQLRRRLGWQQERLLLSTSHEYWGISPFDSGAVTIDPYNAPSATIFSNLNIDITQYHKYRISMVGYWLSFFIDGQLVNAFYDYTGAYANGYIGFRALENSICTIRNFKSRLLYPQVSTFGLNPGDDMDSSLGHIQDIQRSWFCSDLFGRFHGTIFESTDPSTYTYENQLYSQKTDFSDKEYVNQITVIGTNVSAIAKDSSSIGKNALIRDMVIVDYTITTLGDAQNRAQNELNDANKFNLQADPAQILNVGSETMDAVTVINTGPNSSAFDNKVRIYNQTIDLDGQSSKYELQIGTGNII
jgi:hypothetical protein